MDLKQHIIDMLIICILSGAIFYILFGALYRFFKNNVLILNYRVIYNEPGLFQGLETKYLRIYLTIFNRPFSFGFNYLITGYDKKLAIRLNKTIEQIEKDLNKLN